MSLFELALALLIFPLVALRLHGDLRRFAIASVEYSGAEAEHCIKFWKENLDQHHAALSLESYQKLKEVCEVKMSILEKQWWRVSIPITAEEHYERLMLREEEKSKRGRFNKLEIGYRVEYGAKNPRDHLSGVIVSIDKKMGHMQVKFRRYSDTGKEPDNSGEEDILKEPWLIWWHEIDDFTFMKNN